MAVGRTDFVREGRSRYHRVLAHLKQKLVTAGKNANLGHCSNIYSKSVCVLLAQDVK